MNTKTNDSLPKRRGRHFRLIAVALLAAAISALVVLGSREKTDSSQRAASVRIGHTGGPLLGPLYAAVDAEGAPALELAQFSTGADIGYALLSGQLDAGLIETDKALALLKAAGESGLKVAGAIEFPYGATLVVRKDLTLRLADLPGHTIAARDRHCALLHQFEQDAARYGIDPQQVKLTFLPFADLIPALEAKVIDGALLKGAHALLAENQGHKVLYQNWEAEAGDECCPATLAQIEFFLIVRGLEEGTIAALVDTLAATSELAPAQIRQTVSASTGYPPEALERFPVPWFSRVSEELEEQLGEAAWCQDDDHDD